MNEKKQSATEFVARKRNGSRNQAVKDNNAVMASSRQMVMQPKLELTMPGDSYEREADRMADYVMRKTMNDLEWLII